MAVNEAWLMMGGLTCLALILLWRDGADSGDRGCRCPRLNRPGIGRIQNCG